MRPGLVRRVLIITVCCFSLVPLVFAVKAYGELPENAKINETDMGGEEDGDVGFDFGDDDEVDIDDI
jgi:hypothetical protein